MIRFIKAGNQVFDKIGDGINNAMHECGLNGSFGFFVLIIIAVILISLFGGFDE
jgi:hypothetical protein